MSKLTIEQVQSQIANVEYLIRNNTVTIAILTTKNGFTTIGMSACVEKADFIKETGEQMALKRATDELWRCEGYLYLQNKAGV